MGQNDEYSRDAYYEYDSMPDLVDDSDDLDTELHPEDWQDMYSQELLDGWMYLREYLDKNYIKIKVGFPQFVELVMEPSKWYTDEPPAPWQEKIWSQVASVPVVGDRLSKENFYAWVNKYVDYL